MPVPRLRFVLLGSADPACRALFAEWEASQSPLQIELSRIVRSPEGEILRAERLGATGFLVLAEGSEPWGIALASPAPESARDPRAEPVELKASAASCGCQHPIHRNGCPGSSRTACYARPGNHGELLYVCEPCWAAEHRIICRAPNGLCPSPWAHNGISAHDTQP